MNTRAPIVLRTTMRSVRPAAAAAALLAFAGCIEWKQPTESERPTIANYIAAVETVGGAAKATLQPGTAPAGGANPVVTAPIPALILLGGTIQVTASSATPFDKIAVVIPDLDDYWELRLPAAVTSQQILIVFSQNVPVPVFQMRFAGGLGGAYGVYQTAPVSMINVGTGDVQVNVTWDSRADVDLHVVDPLGEEVYWAHRSSVSGGQLDLDSNAGCGSDGPRAENIFWASGLVAPRGDYVVRVDHWSNCSAEATNYVVTINVRGKPPQVFTGRFTGQGDAGGRGSGKLITTATY
ncbi:MAG: hypothetical protein IT356_07960 [Gemmatimonadaceae bacterium]|nr:hypothetical protein [Gemmatimonadaceae bacterium]